MTNTLIKFLVLSEELKEDAATLRRNGVYGCCAGTYEHAAACIDAIVRESEAQEDAGAAEAKAWLLDVMGTWDFTIPTEAFNKIVNRIAARATPRTEPAEGRKVVAQVAKRTDIRGGSFFLWTYPGGLHGFLEDHPVGTKLYAAPPAGGGAS